MAPAALLRFAIGALVGLLPTTTASSLVHPFFHTLPDAPVSSHKAHNFSIPVDHFHNESRYEPHSYQTFSNRYWINDEHYKPGGPVILYAAGEVSGDARIPTLDYGIVDILAKNVNGLGVVLEHRYYGLSYPVQNLTTENLRFLSTEQALADLAYFAQNVIYPGHEDKNLTASDVPYILWGGSYAGAFVAIARKVYPDIFWGAISSSGVTAVVDDFWEYLEAARLYAPGNCAPNHQRMVHIVDNILLGGDDSKKLTLKKTFGLESLDDPNFGYAVAQGIFGFQSVVWDPFLNGDDFSLYCGALMSNVVLYPNTRHVGDRAAEIIEWGGYEADEATVTLFLNFLGYIQTIFARTFGREKVPNVAALMEKKKKHRSETDIPQSMIRPWIYQTCTQWGYFVTGSGTPKDQLPMISRLVDYDYATAACRDWFNITTRPDVDSINDLGGFNFSYPRVALIDGEADPWRQATPHSIGLNSHRESTSEEPFILIGGGALHHWDSYGLAEGMYGPGLPPGEVKSVQDQEVEFVKGWLKVWEEENGSKVLEDDEVEEEKPLEL